MTNVRTPSKQWKDGRKIYARKGPKLLQYKERASEVVSARKHDGPRTLQQIIFVYLFHSFSSFQLVLSLIDRCFASLTLLSVSCWICLGWSRRSCFWIVNATVAWVVLYYCVFKNSKGSCYFLPAFCGPCQSLSILFFWKGSFSLYWRKIVVLQPPVVLTGR